MVNAPTNYKRRSHGNAVVRKVVRYRHIFSQLDRDQNNEVSAAELSSAMQEFSSRTGAPCEKLWAIHDAMCAGQFLDSFQTFLSDFVYENYDNDGWILDILPNGILAHDSVRRVEKEEYLNVCEDIVSGVQAYLRRSFTEVE